MTSLSALGTISFKRYRNEHRTLFTSEDPRILWDEMGCANAVFAVFSCWDLSRFPAGFHAGDILRPPLKANNPQVSSSRLFPTHLPVQG